MYVEYGRPEFEHSDAETGVALVRAFGLSEADVAANRDNELSPRQRQALLARAAALAGQLLLTALFLLAVVAGLAIVGAAAGGMFSFGAPLNPLKRGFGRFWFAAWAVASGLGAMLLVFAGVAGRKVALTVRLYHLALDLKEGRVDTFSGRLSTNRSSEFDDPLCEGRLSFYLCTPHEKFEVPRTVMEEVEAGGGTSIHTLYFTPRSRFLVAATPGLP